MNKKRINNAVDVINFAIKNNISVKKASVECGYSNTYVKNTKAAVLKRYRNGKISDKLYKLFTDTYKHYQENFSTDNKGSNGDVTGQLIVKGTDNSKDVEWKGKSTIAMRNPEMHIKTLDHLLSETDVDLDVWKVKDYTVNKWDVTSWKNVVAETVQNFQVKARLEKIVEIDRAKTAAKIFREMIRNYTPPKNFVNLKGNLSKEENLLEISIFDLHIGKLAWGGETGENYDVKIACKRFMDAITTLVERSSGFNVNRILFPIGNDFFNSDNMQNTTTRGTPQDEDLRWQKTFKLGTRLLVDGINYLKTLGLPIDILIVPGNHDFERSYYMGSFLEAWFNDDKQININNGASPRKYYRFGNTLLGFTHGNEEKEGSLPMLMANDYESKPLWSETIYHEWHLGHIHRKRNVKYSVTLDRDTVLNEDLGVVIRYLSSLTGTEEWHHKKGFIGSIKAADGFIWNKENGLIAHLNANLKL